MDRLKMDADGQELVMRQIAASPITSTWLRAAITGALERDPVDVLNDAEALVKLLTVRERLVAQEAQNS